jgi:hypothetical protein
MIRIDKVSCLFLCALSIVVAGTLTQSHAQVSTCPSNQPPCRNQTQPPMDGHGPASNLPPTLCSNCQGDVRRVITIRIDATWNVGPNGNATPGQTNVYIWNAVQCAINQWNSARAPDGYTTGYYLVLDQAGEVPGQADMTITRQQVYYADGTPAYGSSTPNWPYGITLSPSNGNLGGGSFQEDDLCGRLAHEIGHELGLSNQGSDCNTIMTGSNANGTRLVNSVSSTDVYQVNRNFDNNTRTNGYCTGYIGDSGGEHVCDTGLENNCNANGGVWDPATCTCTDPTGCDQTQASYCWNSGGNWNSDICTCDYPQYYYGGGGGYYCQYECYDYYTGVSTDGEHWEYQYQGTDCYQTGCYYYY